MLLGTEVGLGPEDIMLDWDDPAPHKQLHSTPTFPPTLTVAKRSPISATIQHLHKSSAVAEMVDRLTTIDMGRKVGACYMSPFCVWSGGRELDLPPYQMVF